MKATNRCYIGIYFSDGLIDGRKKRDINLAFSPSDDLYIRCKDLGSSEIKRIIGIDSYAQLVQEASKEDRSLGNYIKHKLRIRLTNEQKNTSR